MSKAHKLYSVFYFTVGCTYTTLVTREALAQ